MLSIKNLGIVVLAVFASVNVVARENVGSGKASGFYKTQAAGCAPATAQVDLNINNVRATLLNGGDMWWDLTAAKYEVPKVDPPGSATSVSSIFSGAIWMGGIDAGGQLKMAAMTYRQNGNDFFPGPLDSTANVDATTCNNFDRFWVVYSSEIDTFKTKTFPVAASSVPKDILEWPGKGNTVPGAHGSVVTIDQDLAPFFDANFNGIYDPQNGDYPVINPSCSNTYGDQMIFWVYNDKGNIHTETSGQAIGVQVGALAFAFATSDEINNMTFYRYNIVNKANIVINQFYMGQWVDPDLGCYQNDYVGCDVDLGLGYCYNGTAVDDGCAQGYGASTPIVGVDYFEGPKDDQGHTLGMSTFLYYNNDFTSQGNPQSAINYYNYMVGKWKDGSPFTSDQCNGKGGSVPTKYMFPGDPGSALPFPQSWSECSCKASNPPGDRRWMQASGPFTLHPGAINNITVGAVWVRQASQSGCAANIALLKAADQKAQALFDNCFKLVDGPDAPDLVIRELQNELIITLNNASTSNNSGEKYREGDPLIKAIAQNDTASHIDTAYSFQGYKIYQLKSQTVSAENLNDPTLARLIAEVDIQDSVTKMINFVNDPSVGLLVPKLMVTGNNKGITHTFDIKSDLFASGADQNLVDHKTYYYTAVAFAHNYYHSQLTGQSQITPYLQGRRNFKVYSGIPHIPTPSQNGFVLHANFGDSIAVIRKDGAGSGGYSVDLDSASIANILASPTNFYGPIVYKGRHSPINVKIVDPYVVKDRKFVVTFLPTATDSFTVDSSGLPIVSSKLHYRVDVLTPNDVLENSFYPTADISSQNDFVLFKPSVTTGEDTSYGVSISLGQVANVGVDAGTGGGRGFIEATIQFQDSLNQWLTGVQDQGTFDYRNWIRSGNYTESTKTPLGPCYLAGFYDDYDTRDFSTCTPLAFYDPQGEFGKILNSTWSPYALASNLINGHIKNITDPTCIGVVPASIYSYGPAFTVTYRYSNNPVSMYNPGTCSVNYKIPDNTLQRLQGVNLVLTDDKTKWTRSVVVEMQEDSAISEGHALKGFYRQHESLDKNYQVIPGDTGRSWFPGYAINVETGERLNIMFGEDSWLGANGRDMIWNPNTEILTQFNQVVFGGRQCVYIMDTRYDQGDSIFKTMHDSITSAGPYAPYVKTAGTFPGNAEMRNTINEEVYDHIMWVTMPVVSSTSPTVINTVKSGHIPTETTVRLRVRKPFSRFVASDSNAGYPQYEFSTAGFEPDVEQHDVAVSALDQIRAVPNPYYAYSAYEINQLDNKIKITNLPANSTVSIYSIDGTLIRQFNRSVTQITSEGASTDKTNLDNSLDWDLKNFKNIPISSGVYLIHVKAPGIGEKVIKWFGALRPTDLDTF